MRSCLRHMLRQAISRIGANVITRLVWPSLKKREARCRTMRALPSLLHRSIAVAVSGRRPLMNFPGPKPSSRRTPSYQAPADGHLPWRGAIPRRSEALRRSLALQPDYGESLTLMALINVFWHGDIATAKSALSQIPVGADPQGTVTFVRLKVAMWSRDYAAALKILDGAPSWVHSNPMHHRLPSVLLRAEALEAVGQSEQAQNAYTEAIRLLETEVNVAPASPGPHGLLGRAYAGVGCKAEAISASRRAVDLLPVSSDAFYGPSISSSWRKSTLALATSMRRSHSSDNCSICRPVSPYPSPC